MVDRYVVHARIAKIREYVALLRRIRGMADERRFVTDPLIYGNAERYLQLAIQAVMYISHHIVADKNLNIPVDSGDLFALLATHKVLPVALSKRLVSMAGFRNILVHRYFIVHSETVYEHLIDRLGDFAEFALLIKKYLDVVDPPRPTTEPKGGPSA